ncbi:Os01g0366100, partial [Oryza sativa Japonica Group]
FLGGASQVLQAKSTQESSGPSDAISRQSYPPPLYSATVPVVVPSPCGLLLWAPQLHGSLPLPSASPLPSPPPHSQSLILFLSLRARRNRHRLGESALAGRVNRRLLVSAGLSFHVVLGEIAGCRSSHRIVSPKIAIHQLSWAAGKAAPRSLPGVDAIAPVRPSVHHHCFILAFSVSASRAKG